MGCPQGEMRVAHHFPPQHDGVGAAGSHDLLSLSRGRDEPDGADADIRLFLDEPCERNLVSGADGDAHPGDVAAARDVEEVSARCSRPAGDNRGLLLVPPARSVIGGGKANEKGHCVADFCADGGGHLEQEPGPAGEISAVLVIAQIAERRQELVQQVSVCRMNLHHVEAGVNRAARCGSEVTDHLRDSVSVQRDGRLQPDERHRGCRDRLPAAVLWQHRAVPVVAPLWPDRRLAASVRELNTGVGASGMDESGDPLPGRGLFVIPDAGVRVGDPARRVHCGRFSDNKTCTPRRHRAEVHQMPILRHAILLRDGVLAHGGDPDAIANGE